jgi:flagellar hook-associated protein 3 FlgL
MSIDGVSGRTSFIGSGIVNLRSQLDTLTQQLSSGKISTTYAGDGTGRSLAIGIRAQVTALSSFTDTQTNVNTRIGVANLSLQRLSDITSEVKGAAVSAGSTLDNTGQTAGQKTASLDFFDSVDMLNAQSGDRYLFSGRATDTAPVAPADQIMNGNGAAIAGLKQIIAERQAADVGATGMGRVILSQPTPTSVQVGEDSAAIPGPPAFPASPFGLKLNAISTSIAGANVTQPSAPVTTPPTPLAMGVDLSTATPQNGDTVKFTFKLPDGTTEDINLTASTATPVPANGFAIGATPAATAANLNTALTTAVKTLANGALVAASAEQAGNDFFGQPPLRIAATTAFLDNGTSGTQVNNKNAVAVTGNTLLSGAAATDSIGTNFSAGNTITVDGQLLTFTAPGGTNDGTHIPVDSNITALLGKIDVLSGNVGPGTTPSSVVNGSVVLHTGTANNLTITTTAPNPNPAFVSLGLTSPVNVARRPATSFLDNSQTGAAVNSALTTPTPINGSTALLNAANTNSLSSGFSPGQTITVTSSNGGTTTTNTISFYTGTAPAAVTGTTFVDLATATVSSVLGTIDTLNGNSPPSSTVTNGSVVLHSGTANGLTIASTNTAAFAALGLTSPVNVVRNGGDTAQVVGTAANTVIWYQGETGTSPARGTAVAQIDAGITVQYGARADEQALRTQLQNVAVFAAVTTSATNPNATAVIAALNQRVANNLATIPGTQTIQDIQADLAGAQASIQSAANRQTQSSTMAQTLLDQIEGVNTDEVATKILALQTALQASYQTTAQLYQMTLVKYLPA